MNVNRTRELVEFGQTDAQRRRLCKQGELVAVRHGAWADEASRDPRDRHLQLIAGTVPVLAVGTVLSHVSAGVLHDLPAWDWMLGRVTALHRSAGHGSLRRNLHLRCAPLDPVEVVEVGGYRVTSRERTAVDLACILSYDRAVAVLDAALHAGADLTVIADTLRAARRRHGVATARAAFLFADPRAESVGESISRVRLARVGLPVPNLQLNIYDQFGRWLARTDFGWEDLGVLGEFDGRVKYLGDPAEVAKVVMAEKLREARLRELGWVVVRWSWDDLADPVTLRRRIEAAFRQARPELVRGRVVAA
ncbi:MAG: hypothetical protein LCH96_16455 [Actinobacteria bacterium]|nr:hypothetical protein [Actinomycetota bacterium]